jgi:hypothetical protein
MLILSCIKDILRRIYDYNHQEKNWKLREYEPGSSKKNDHEWGGPRTRRLLYAAYTIALLCLLRFDEVLKIQAHDIDVAVIGNKKRMTLTLPFRKTAQFGSIRPFPLYILDETEAHLCAVRALADWLHVSRIKQGYVFRRMASGDRILENNVPMVRESFQILIRCLLSSGYSLRSSFSSFFVTICWMWALIHIHMELTPFDVEAVSIWPPVDDGIFIVYVNGEVGALSFPT